MTLCLGKRCELVKQEYISGNRMELLFDMPLGEIVIDFYDKLKSISKGYASFDWHHNGFRPSNLVKLDILLNGEQVDALSTLTHRDNAENFGRRMCEKLKEPFPIACTSRPNTLVACKNNVTNKNQSQKHAKLFHKTLLSHS